MTKVVAGEFRRQPIRSWKTDDNHAGMTCYLGMTGRIALSDLLEHFAKEYPHVDTAKLEFNFATVVWDEPATPEDVALRQKQRAQHAERLERWERETLDRLRAKYDPKEKP